MPTAPRQELSHEQPAREHRAQVCLQPALGTPLQGQGVTEGTGLSAASYGDMFAGTGTD